ncbi:synaptic ras gtpase activating syngap [Schistosoma japonicum]|nr:synaptic ras gtpase activating syngap [Schistosoma japonicum]
MENGVLQLKLLFRMKNYFFRPTSRSPTRNSSSNQRNFTNKKDQIYRNFVDLCTESPKVRTFSSSPSISMKYVNLLNGKFISIDNIGISDVQYWKFIRKRLRKSRRQSLKSVLHNPPHCLYRDNYLGTFQRSISFQQIKCKNKDPTSTFISSNSLLGSSTSLNSFANFEFSKDKPRQSTVSMMQTQLQCSHHISSDNIYCQHTKNNKKDGLLETVEHIVDYIPIKERSFQNFTEPVCNKHCDSINGTFKQTMNKCVCSTKRSPIFSSSSSLQYTGFKNNNNGCNHCSAFIYSLVQAGTVHVSTIHQSLTGGRPFCFVFTGPIVQMSSVEKKECLKDTTLFTRIFAAESWESRAKWMKR